MDGNITLLRCLGTDGSTDGICSAIVDDLNRGGLNGSGKQMAQVTDGPLGSVHPSRISANRATLLDKVAVHPTRVGRPSVAVQCCTWPIAAAAIGPEEVPMNKKQQSDLDNRSRQLNSQDGRFWQSRGAPVPPANIEAPIPGPPIHQPAPTPAVEGEGKK
jgi:hypothetical protein